MCRKVMSEKATAKETEVITTGVQERKRRLKDLGQEWLAYPAESQAGQSDAKLAG